jgi:hypothetical protein
MIVPSGSTAVMASRNVSPANALDFFPTPPWTTRAVVHEVLRPEFLLPLPARIATAWDPCCGAGHMAIPLAETFGVVHATDVHDWGFGSVRNLDFTMATRETCLPVDWIICNPPYALAERFLDRALSIARVGVAMLLRLQWLEGIDRYNQVFSGLRRPLLICPFAERVPMIEGCWDPEATSATAYAWFIWEAVPPEFPRRSSVLHFPPGMADRYTRSADEALASRGEAARRLAAKKAAARAVP